MIEIDQTFASLNDWMVWASENSQIFSIRDNQEIVDRILRNGFIEPLTGNIVMPQTIYNTESNWREGLVANGLNSRMRAVMSLIEKQIGHSPKHEVCIFATEAITPFALQMRGLFARFLGSEYGYDESARQALFPIAHQDLTSLTLPSNSFDLVTTNEVLEHVPSLDMALAEIARVLKVGGWHIGTHPFRFMDSSSDLRAYLINGQIINIKEPEYHGNPVDPVRGSLVFETPGWDIIQRALNYGFTKAHMRFLCSESHGVMTDNAGVFVFCAQK